MSVKISRILHAGYIFESQDVRIIFDPIFENPFSHNCYAFPEVSFELSAIKKQKFAAIFISHFHDDHCSFESLNLLDRETPIYLYCIHEELFELIKQLGFIHVHSLRINSGIKIGPFEVIPCEALEPDIDSIFHIKVENLNILNVVDSWIDFSIIQVLSHFSPWDLVLWPFQTMRELDVLSPRRSPVASTKLPPEWVSQIKALNPRFIVPSSCQFRQESWSWYNQCLFPISYSQFMSEIKLALPKSQVIKLNPSSSIILNKKTCAPSSPIEWVCPIGNQDVDYEYIPQSPPPSTAEIAKNFMPLSDQQKQRVVNYCTSDILSKYGSIAVSEEPYFEKTRVWSLNLYDHQGLKTSFCYLVNKKNIEIATNIVEPIGWLTELPMAKLYAALEQGETLTSMYIRINEMIFDEDIEHEINLADVMIDPLIRCLFEGVFGAYQKEQLKKLKMKNI